MGAAEDVLDLTRKLRAMDWAGKPDPLSTGQREAREGLLGQLAAVAEEGFLALTAAQRDALRQDVAMLHVDQDAGLLAQCPVPTLPREIPDAQVEGWIASLHGLCVYAGAREENARAVLVRARRLHADWERLWKAVSAAFIGHKWKVEGALGIILRDEGELLALLEEHAERWTMRTQRLREAYASLSRILTAKQGLHGALRRYSDGPPGTVPWGNE